MRIGFSRKQCLCTMLFPLGLFASQVFALPYSQPSDIAPDDQSAPLTIVNDTLPKTKTKIFIWTDERGIKHYSDSATKAPKTAQSRVVVTVQPPYTPPLPLYTPPADAPSSEQAPNENEEVTNNQELPSPATPPVSLPPSQLPPIPPSF